jgi:hypothetical protein
LPTLQHPLLTIFHILRKIPINVLGLGVSTHIFTNYFKDFHKIEAVKTIFGEDAEKTLKNLKVDLTWIGGYMYINSSNGHLVISKNYLNNGNKIDIYLDLIHELYHIKQYLDGRKLFDQRYDYVERPTEIEAYRYTIQEARRLGLSEKRICQYLKTEWLTESDLKRLATAVGVSCN